METNLTLKIKGSSFSLTPNLYKALSELKGKAFRNSIEELALLKFNAMLDCYESMLPKTETDINSYRLSDNGMAIDIVLEIDRPSIKNLAYCNKDGNKLKVGFKLGIFEESPTEMERTSFVNWYINNFESLIRYIVSRKEGCRLIQILPSETYWEIHEDELSLDLTYQIVF